MTKCIKTVCIFLCISSLTGCGLKDCNARNMDNGNSVENVINDQMEASDAKESTDQDANKSETAVGAEKNTENEETVDYDLTDMNKDMVYATVYQMLVNPDSYIGKTVRMSGPFCPYTNMDRTVYYPACIIEDALACCQQGIEFVVKDAVYPDDYPETGTVITVTGTFETYEENGNVFCHINNAVMEIDN